MSQFRVEAWRGGMVESVHLVSVAIIRHDSLIAVAGRPDLVTFWRSAAKPFQALPLVTDGAAASFGLGPEQLALACASHSSEPIHLESVKRFLDMVGCLEDDLACGGHPPLSSAEADRLMRAGVEPTPLYSNCSGKHTAMLAMTKHAGWDLSGYHLADHPLQQRLLQEVASWTGTTPEEIKLGIDGCNVPCYGISLEAQARAYARLGASEEEHAVAIRNAMAGHPLLVGGTGRPCTDVMLAARGSIIAKIGAEGIYGCCLPGSGVGVALKVEDGSIRSAPVALMEVLRQLADRELLPGPVSDRLAQLSHHAEPPIGNTRGVTTGRLQAAGALSFLDA